MVQNKGVILQNLYEVTDDQGNVRQKTPEQKQYLILEKFSSNYDDNPADRTWSVLTGRSNVIEFLRDELNASGDELDLGESLIIVEGICITEAVKLVEFMTYCLDQNYVTDSQVAEQFDYYIRQYYDKSDSEPEDTINEAPSSEARVDVIYDKNTEYEEV